MYRCPLGACPAPATARFLLRRRGRRSQRPNGSAHARKRLSFFSPQARPPASGFTIDVNGRFLFDSIRMFQITDANTALAYTVDPATGYFIPTANSPFSIPQIAGAFTFSIPPGQQGISGPSVSVSATRLSFGTIQTGSSSMPQMVTVTSNGGQALRLNSISLSGTDPTQFIESDTCQAPSVLQPNKFCSVSVTFAPKASGTGNHCDKLR